MWSSKLGEFGLDRLAARAGRVPGGYAEPTEAAYELVLEALAPVEAGLRRMRPQPPRSQDQPLVRPTFPSALSNASLP